MNSAAISLALSQIDGALPACLPDSLAFELALLYSIFGLVFLLRKQARNLYQRVPGPDALKLVVLFLLVGVLTESLAWAKSYLKAAEEPALFHPQLIPDLIIGVDFYGGWALAWLVVLRWYRFTKPNRRYVQVIGPGFRLLSY